MIDHIHIHKSPYAKQKVGFWDSKAYFSKSKACFFKRKAYVLNYKAYFLDFQAGFPTVGLAKTIDKEETILWQNYYGPS